MTTLSLDQGIRQALALFRAGQLVEAERAADEILAGERRHGDALSLRGLIAYERGDFDRAADWHRRAAAANPSEPLYLCNLAGAMLALGRPDEAIRSCDRALALRAGHVLRWAPVHL